MLEKMRNRFLISAFCLIGTFAVNGNSRNNHSLESSIHEEGQLLGLTTLGQIFFKHRRAYKWFF